MVVPGLAMQLRMHCEQCCVNKHPKHALHNQKCEMLPTPYTTCTFYAAHVNLHWVEGLSRGTLPECQLASALQA
jgi:hypothetical protein